MASHSKSSKDQKSEAEKKADASEKISHTPTPAPSKEESSVKGTSGKNENPAAEENALTISSQTVLISIIVILAVGLVVWKIQSTSSDSPSPPPPSVLADEPVARVNGELVMRSEITHQLEKIPFQLRSQVSFDEILNSTIKERLLIQEAKKQGIEVSKPEAGAYLAMMMNSSGISKDDLSRRAKEKGVSEDEILDIVWRRLLVNGLLQQNVFPGITINDAEIKRFYDDHKAELSVPEMVHAKHILLAGSDEANATLNRLRKGADFDSLAKDLSIDKGSAARGGDLGNFTKGMMVPEFEQAAFSGKPGELVGPVKTAFGYHVIKILGHTKGRDRSFEELKDAIVRKLKADKSEAAANAYVEKLRGEATIEFLAKPSSARSIQSGDKP